MADFISEWADVRFGGERDNNAEGCGQAELQIGELFRGGEREGGEEGRAVLDKPSARDFRGQQGFRIRSGVCRLKQGGAAGGRCSGRVGGQAVKAGKRCEEKSSAEGLSGRRGATSGQRRQRVLRKSSFRVLEVLRGDENQRSHSAHKPKRLRKG